jgi:glucose/arabinose dehydrogenase
MASVKEENVGRILSCISAAILFLVLSVLPSQAQWPGIALAKSASGLLQPVRITNADDGSNRLFVVEQGGTIRIIQNGSVRPTPFLNISNRISTGGERGLLGLAFPPDYAAKGYFYVNYTRISDGATVVARFRITANPDIANPNSEEIILVISQPFANHNGGNIAFSPIDGFLYIGMGDGGAANDPDNYAQNLTPLPGKRHLLGKMLRIDVESGVIPYAIPLTNPVLGGRRNAMWAMGLRNPWAFSFDRATGDLYIGDVGQNSWEEIDFQPATSTGGENYGWRIFEGNHCNIPAAGCMPPERYSPPVAEYPHSSGCSVTGGNVYRAAALPLLDGIYFYGDFCSGRVWGMRKSGSVWKKHLLSDTPFFITAFGEAEDGSIYLADYATGDIYRIAQAIAITSPTGGEKIQAGTSFPITWQANQDSTSFALYYSTDSGITWKLIAEGLTGSDFPWTVPTFPKTKKAVRVKVIGFDAQGTKVCSDKSDGLFKIIPVP